MSSDEKEVPANKACELSARLGALQIGSKLSSANKAAHSTSSDNDDPINSSRETTELSHALGIGPNYMPFLGWPRLDEPLPALEGAPSVGTKPQEKARTTGAGRRVRPNKNGGRMDTLRRRKALLASLTAFNVNARKARFRQLIESTTKTDSYMSDAKREGGDGDKDENGVSAVLVIDLTGDDE